MPGNYLAIIQTRFVTQQIMFQQAYAPHFILLDLLLFRTFPDADIEPKRVNHKKKRKFIFISSGSFVCHHLHLNLQFKRHNKHYMVI